MHGYARGDTRISKWALPRPPRFTESFPLYVFRRAAVFSIEFLHRLLAWKGAVSTSVPHICLNIVCFCCSTILGVFSGLGVPRRPVEVSLGSLTRSETICVYAFLWMMGSITELFGSRCLDLCVTFCRCVHDTVPETICDLFQIDVGVDLGDCWDMLWGPTKFVFFCNIIQCQT